MTVVAWKPQPGPQTLFVQCPAFECLYGGSLGGGKTDALLGDFSRGIDKGANWVGVFLRRHRPDMDDVIRRSMAIFGPVYGGECYNGSKYQWNFPTGAVLQFRAVERDLDVEVKFQGQQYQWVGFDELTQWATPYQYTYLITRLRSAQGVEARIRAATNPGGVGHHWVKERFIDPVPPGVPQKLVSKRSGKPMYRVFVPAKLFDNKILCENDPDYADRVTENIDPVLAAALIDGRWDILHGAAFTEWNPAVHVIDPYPIPTDKKIWRALDWGFVEPYAAGWFFEYDGDVIMGHEMYGYGGSANVGSREPATEVRRKIENFEQLNDIYVPVGLIDGQTKEQQGSDGGLIFDLLGGRDLGWKAWPKGPHSRVQQKQNFHQFLSVTNGSSRFKVMRHCRHTIRTLPSLPTDRNNMEDVDTNAEDHCYDMIRGALTMKVHSRDELRQRALRRKMRKSNYIQASELEYGGS